MTGLSLTLLRSAYGASYLLRLGVVLHDNDLAHARFAVELQQLLKEPLSSYHLRMLNPPVL